MRKLTREQKRDIAAIAGKKDEDIDFSDVPAVVDWSLDADVLEWLKAYGKGYQTRANLLLRHAMVSSRGRASSARSTGARRKRDRRSHSIG